MKQEKSTNLKSQISNLRSQISNSRSQISNSRSQISNSRSQISNSRSQISKSRSRFSNLNSQISNRRSEISNRHGFTLLEVSVAGVLLVLLMAVAAQMFGWIASERRAADRRQWAIQEATNVMESLTAQPFERLTSQQAEDVELSAAARRVLPEAQLKVTVVDESEHPSAKRLVVAVEWLPQPAQPVARVALTSWVFRREGTER